MGTLTGTGPEIIDRIHELEAAGVTNIALNVCGTDAREMIREFGREVIDKYCSGMGRGYLLSSRDAGSLGL